MSKPIRTVPAPPSRTEGVANLQRTASLLLFIEMLLYAAVLSFGFIAACAFFFGEGGLKPGEVMLEFWYIWAGLTTVVTHLLFKRALAEEQDRLGADPNAARFSTPAGEVGRSPRASK